MVDSSAVMKVEGRKRQHRSIAEKRRIVELAMLPGASVAGVARQHGVNANMVHYWRKLYRQGRLGEKKGDSIRLLPVSVSESAVDPFVQTRSKSCSASTVMPATTAGVIYLEFSQVHLRIENGVDAELVRIVLETLQR
ncbi:MAG TPA: transposase [Candidatus Methylomirabilis sp.]|nr:transposase [Candidatus Methylomirabilis sp.]